MVGVAQLAERRSVAAEVFTGSSPVAHPTFQQFSLPENFCILKQMLNSLKTSHLLLRLGLALVFLWFGVDKFIHPDYWINAWMPQWFQNILSGLNIGNLNFIYANGIFEMVIGLGFLFNIFVKMFALLTVLFLLAVIFSFGLNEVIIRDAGLIGAALALLFWNSRKSRTF